MLPHPSFFLILLLPLFSFFFLCSSNLATADSNYDNFAQCLAKNSIPADQIGRILFSRTNSSYSSVLNAYIRNRRFTTSSTPKPNIIVTPLAVNHVQATVLCAKSLSLQLKIRSGGHDYEGTSYISESKTPFVVLDMFNLRSIDVDIEHRLAWVQSGATLGELYYRIWGKSKLHTFPAGVCPTVGVGGHISGGGYGVLLRNYGLTVDHLIDAQIVDVNGRVLDRSSMGEDLFWAIKGGGGASFGVILGYQIRLVTVPDIVTVFRVEKTVDQNATGIVYKWQEIATKIDDRLFIRVLLQPISGKVKGTKTVRATFIALFLGDSRGLISLMNTEFPELGLVKNDCIEMGWTESVLWWANFKNTTDFKALLSRKPDSVNFLKRKSDYVQTPISKDGLELIFKKLAELGKTGLVFNPYGGRMNEIPENETPFPHRYGVMYKIQYSVNWEDTDPALEKKYIDQTRQLYEFMTPYVSKNPRQAFLNYRDLDIGTTSNGPNSYSEGKVFGEKYFKGNFDRLVKVKTMVDPGNFFKNEQSIPTLSAFSGRKGGK